MNLLATLLGILSAASFYTIPYIWGISIRKVFKVSPLNRNYLDNFVLGSLAYAAATYFFFFLSKTISLPSLYLNFFPVLLRFLAFISFIYVLPSLIKLLRHRIRLLPPLIILATLTIDAYAIWRSGTQYPFTLNWDFFHHQTLANNIMAGSLSPLNSHISDTFIFNGYSNLFHLLYLLPQLLFRADILTYFWWLELFHLFSIAAVTFYLAKIINPSNWLAIPASIFSTFVFESYIGYTAFLFIPQTFTVFIAFLLVGTLLKPHSLSTKKTVCTNLIFLVLLHFVIGLATLLLLAAAALFRFLQNHLSLRLQFLPLFLLLLSIVIIPFIKLPFDLNFLNQGEAASFNLTLLQKYQYYATFSGWLLFIFFAIGTIFTFVKRQYQNLTLLFIALCTILALMLPLAYSFKFSVLAHIPLSLIAGYGFYSLVKTIHSRFIRTLALSSLTVTLSFILLSSSNSLKNTLITPYSQAQFSTAEYAAALFLKANYATKANTLLISDPATQQILEPLSGLNSQGGAYANPGTRVKLINFNNTGSIYPLFSIHDTLLSHQPDHYLLILSGRYFRWQELPLNQKLNLSNNIWQSYPLTINDRLKIDSYQALPETKLVFSNSQVAILEINR